MTRKELDNFLSQHNLQVDDSNPGAGKFADLAVGTGEDFNKLQAVRTSLGNTYSCKNMLAVKTVSNPGHKDYGKLYLEIASFWNE